MKKNKLLITIIIILLFIIINMGIYIFLLQRSYNEQEDILNETEKEIAILKEQIKVRCPGKFNFVDK